MELSLSTIPDLTAYVTKQGAYPAAHGGFADIWMCTLNNEAYPSIAQNVAVKVLRSLGSGFNNEGKPKKVRKDTVCFTRVSDGSNVLETAAGTCGLAGAAAPSSVTALWYCFGFWALSIYGLSVDG
ncbi:hypothetical protein PC9H_004506 [Pleurotus ostreatus]|uniref:Uncharacterized protein n=1 Tax=Pleurotus ostreatus TaxID=5322 RepID=A0A8H7DUN6_PLEOS|nr:uncharacterized protein PC9H_004506 [Pleurotus ostreatus]KAF7432565.1 hypothetical protein PC9H_004506 [Pleurotus ostreatus]